ncbi:methyltransferase domain-containing protein [Brachybacterium tyrofermentans]|uniref:methyltransferase domain-containing protein n=1 Tax=Brachybacterium tyrofermentans TaxID=47848 RepID=UPI003FCFEA10
MPTPDPAQARWNDYWTRYAAEYDEHQLSRLAHPEERETWTRIWAEALPAGPCTVLDVGTGSGNVALLLAGAGHGVTGIDLSEGMLEQAHAKCAEHPDPPTFLVGDAVEPPFAPGTFDAIVSRYLLWTLRDAPAALSRWYELLRPGGVLVAVDAAWFRSEEELPRGTERQDDFASAYDAEAFERLSFGRAGAEQIVAEWEAAGFLDARADPLTDVLELDRAHGVAPGHSPQLQHRFSARKPD